MLKVVAIEKGIYTGLKNNIGSLFTACKVNKIATEFILTNSQTATPHQKVDAESFFSYAHEKHDDLIIEIKNFIGRYEIYRERHPELQKLNLPSNQEQLTKFEKITDYLVFKLINDSKNFGLELSAHTTTEYTIDAVTLLKSKIMAYGKYSLHKEIIKSSDVAIIYHCHYYDRWKDFISRVDKKHLLNIDFIITTTSEELADKISQQGFNNVFLIENRGRDILPFIYLLPKIIKSKYNCVLKMHSKKSLHDPELGNRWMEEIYTSFLNPGSIEEAMDQFKDPHLGMILPKKHICPPFEEKLKRNRKHINSICLELNLRYSPIFFPAGSMFWFKPEALAKLSSINTEKFKFEDGSIDGSRQHAIERLFTFVCESEGYNIIPSNE